MSERLRKVPATTELGPRCANSRPRDPKEPSPLSEAQVTAFRPGNGTTYKNEQSPRMPVKFDLGQRAA